MLLPASEGLAVGPNPLHEDTETALNSQLAQSSQEAQSDTNPGQAVGDFELLNRYWDAANYLTVAQIYLQENALLASPLTVDHIKPRLLGHWGTSPGLSLIYVHLNRLIRRTGARILFVAGPGHGGPAVIANLYLEGSYSEIYPHVGQNPEGLRQLIGQFSTPGGIPSHVGPPTPGSIHEGGELGYSLAHATGAVMDNPDLIVAAELTAKGHRVGAETVAKLLKANGLCLQANTKTLEGNQHPDRNTQFGYINAQASDHLDAGQPVISIDAKNEGTRRRLQE